MSYLGFIVVIPAKEAAGWIFHNMPRAGRASFTIKCHDDLLYNHGGFLAFNNARTRHTVTTYVHPKVAARDVVVIACEYLRAERADSLTSSREAHAQHTVEFVELLANAPVQEQMVNLLRNYTD